MNNLENLEKKYEKLGQEIEKLKKQKLQEKYTPDEGEIYYFINDMGDVVYSTCENDKIDNYRRDFLKIFKTKEEVYEYLDYIKAKKEASYEFSKEEWENEAIAKYYIYYNYEDENIIADSKNFIYRDMGKTYFKNIETMENFINKYLKQIKKFEFGIEEENNE